MIDKNEKRDRAIKAHTARVVEAETQQADREREHHTQKLQLERDRDLWTTSAVSLINEGVTAAVEDFSRCGQAFLLLPRPNKLYGLLSYEIWRDGVLRATLSFSFGKGSLVSVKASLPDTLSGPKPVIDVDAGWAESVAEAILLYLLTEDEQKLGMSTLLDRDRFWLDIKRQGADKAAVQNVRLKQAAKVAGTNVKNWLISLMKQSPTVRRNKDQLFGEAREQFGANISRRSFDKTYSDAIDQVPGCKWNIQGRTPAGNRELDPGR